MTGRRSSLRLLALTAALAALAAAGAMPQTVGAQEEAPGEAEGTAAGVYEGPPKSDAAAYTQYVVRQAIALYEAEGREAALAYQNSPVSVDGQWYVFVVDGDGYLIANPVRPDLVGTRTSERLDLRGKAYGQEIVATTEQGSWVSYFFTHPETGEPEQKHSWVVLHDGLVFGSGWYDIEADEAPPKLNRRAYTKHLVQQAIDRYDAEGRDYAVAYHNSPESVDGPWYVSIASADGTVLAHPTRPELVGADGNEFVDLNGKRFGAEVLATDENGHWVDHYFLHPETREPAPKHTWAVRHDGHVFIAGWYEPTEAPARSDLASFTQYMVQKAVERYDAEGREAAMAHYNAPESIDGEWYVFILDGDGVFLAHASRPDLLGVDGSDFVDVNGKPYAAELEAADENGRWVDYYFTHPDTRRDERKHTWALRHDGLILGSGWYQVSPDATDEMEADPEAEPAEPAEPVPDNATG